MIRCSTPDSTSPATAMLALAATRFVCVGVLFELLLRRRGAPEAMVREDRWVFVVSALLGYTLYQGAFILALGSKEAAFTWPAAVVLVDIARGRPLGATLRALAPAAALAAS